MLVDSYGSVGRRGTYCRVVDAARQPVAALKRAHRAVANGLHTIMWRDHESGLTAERKERPGPKYRTGRGVKGSSSVTAIPVCACSTML